MGKNPKILIFDLEVSTLRVETETYGLKVFNPYHSHKDITRDYALHGAAWKWLNDDKVHCISVSPKDPFNDDAVTKAIYDQVSQADIIVGHNVDRFDLRKLNTRALKHGLPPIQKIVSVDTLKLARKHFDVSSNTLAYLAKFLDLPVEKDASPDWSAIRAGDAEALSYMRDYNRRDVIVTEQVYLKLRSWDYNPPNVAAIMDTRDISGNKIKACPACGSATIVNNGSYMTRQGVKRPKFLCRSCDHSFVGRVLNGKL